MWWLSRWLLLLSLFVSAEATRRLVGGTGHVDGLPVLAASGVAAAVMVVGAVILGGDVGSDEPVGDELNMRAVLLDTAGDAAAAAGVAIAGAVIVVTGGYYWLDPSVALVISLVVGFQAAALLREVTSALRLSAQPASGGPPH